MNKLLTLLAAVAIALVVWIAYNWHQQAVIEHNLEQAVEGLH
jgi:hypothetical protein